MTIKFTVGHAENFVALVSTTKEGASDLDVNAGTMRNFKYGIHIHESDTDKIKCLFPDGIPDADIQEVIRLITVHIHEPKEVQVKKIEESGLLDKWLNRGANVSSIVTSILPFLPGAV
ncbi:TPA: hypothetical protein LSG62_003251 [Serratia liquefaciens]|nr:hypothetical protein [Serratia liquefaciens]